MAIRPSDLDTPERGLSLAHRGPELRRAVAEPEPQEDVAAAELKALRAKIAAARKIKPTGGELHCADCWGKGRDAALRVVEGKT